VANRGFRDPSSIHRIKIQCAIATFESLPETPHSSQEVNEFVTYPIGSGIEDEGAATRLDRLI
jgi:hypothetical protein